MNNQQEAVNNSNKLGMDLVNEKEKEKDDAKVASMIAEMAIRESKERQELERRYTSSIAVVVADATVNEERRYTIDDIHEAQNEAYGRGYKDGVRAILEEGVEEA